VVLRRGSGGTTQNGAGFTSWHRWDDAKWRWIYVVSPVGRRKKQPVYVVADGQDLNPKTEMETANLLGINGLQKSHQTAGMASIFQNCFCSNSLPQPGHFNFGFRVKPTFGKQPDRHGSKQNPLSPSVVDSSAFLTLDS